MRVDPDRTLVMACQESPDRGFDGAFRDLYEQYKDRVYNVCYRTTGNAADALDASQETFGILFRKVSAFRFESKFSSWVYRIAVNASIDLKRRSAARPATSLDRLRSPSDDSAPIDFKDDEVEGPEAAATRHELQAEIQEAITVLRYNESLSYEEIAECLGTSLGTVKSRLSRAHAALDRELTPVLDRHHLR